MDEFKRVFICVEMPEEVIKEIARVQEQIDKKLKFVGKTTELENLHLTLKFFGEINDQKIKEVDARLQNVEFKSMKARLGNIGLFTYHNKPRILWVKILGDVRGLQKQIDSALESLFPIEERFMSHMTIARIKYVEDIKYQFPTKEEQ